MQGTEISVCFPYPVFSTKKNPPKKTPKNPTKQKQSVKPKNTLGLVTFAPETLALCFLKHNSKVFNWHSNHWQFHRSKRSWFTYNHQRIVCKWKILIWPLQFYCHCQKTIQLQNQTRTKRKKPGLNWLSLKCKEISHLHMAFKSDLHFNKAS